MEILFTSHARKQIAERRLSEEAVGELLQNPGQMYEEEGVWLLQARYSEEGKEYLLRAVARRESDRWIVLTAYKTSKTEKYWRGES